MPYNIEKMGIYVYKNGSELCMKKEKNTETNTYVVDREYRLQYIGKNLKKRFPDLKI